METEKWERLEDSRRKFIDTRGDTISDDLDTVYAGVSSKYPHSMVGFDTAAARVAEYLTVLAESVQHWARTPQDHGGNPYRHAFVMGADDVSIENGRN